MVAGLMLIGQPSSHLCNVLDPYSPSCILVISDSVHVWHPNETTGNCVQFDLWRVSDPPRVYWLRHSLLHTRDPEGPGHRPQGDLATLHLQIYMHYFLRSVPGMFNVCAVQMQWVGGAVCH